MFKGIPLALEVHKGTAHVESDSEKGSIAKSRLSLKENSMDIQTHKRIDPELCGKPVHLEDGLSRVTMNTTDKMRVDDSGLVHGGFVFGLADYAAMIAVNHPNVVLGGADVKFLKPIRVNEAITAEAKVIKKQGRKRNVQVSVMKGNEKVFEGEFICFVLGKHVFN